MLPQNKKRISYLTNCYAPPDQVGVGSATRHYYHVEALVKAGWGVDVITASTSTISDTTISVESIRPEILISIVPINTISTDKMAARIKYHATFSLRGFWRVLHIRKSTLVIASIPSLLIGWQGYIIAMMRKAKLIVDVRDLWTDSLTTTNLAHLPLFLPFNRFLEKLLYRRADLITCTSEAQAKEIRRIVGEQVPVCFVPNGLDPEIRATSSQPHPLIHKIRQRYRWIGLYAGKHAQYSGLDTLLTVAKELEPDNFALLLVGSGYTKAGLLKKSREKRLKNVFFHNSVPKKEIGSFLMGADIFFINYTAAEAWQKVLPNKLFSYMYWNRPIIAAVVPGEITRVLSESGAGMGVPPGDPAAIVRAVRQYLKNESWENNSRNYLLKHFDRRKTAETFVDACHQVLN
jgi:glycosyltransferase involved in cell wall biosynthesis